MALDKVNSFSVEVRFTDLDGRSEMVLSPEQIDLLRASVLVALQGVRGPTNPPVDFYLTMEWADGRSQSHEETSAGGEVHSATAGVHRCICSYKVK